MRGKTRLAALCFACVFACGAEDYTAFIGEMLPKVAEILDGDAAAVKDLEIKFVSEPSGEWPAWTFLETKEIHLNEEWAAENADEVKGAIVHEIAHLVQNYSSHRPPSWLLEGIADWVRWFNYEPREAQDAIRTAAAKSRVHNAGYRTTAAFLERVDKRHGRDFVRRLNAVCRAGEYNGAKTWTDLTGKTQEELAQEWRASMKPRETPPEAITMATYNLRRSGDKGDKSWKVRYPLVLGVIAERRLELAGFQEVNPDQFEDLKAGLPGWDYVGVGRDADGGGEASPIFWRTDRFEKLEGGVFWLSETPEVPGSMSWGAAYPRVCSWVKLHDRKAGKDFAYFNCHTDHKSIAARQEGLRLVMRRIDEFAAGMPVVFGGDLNDEIMSDKKRAEVEKKDGTRLAPDTPEHPINIVRAKFKDSYDITETPHTGSYWTDNGYRNKHVKRIDYIFVSEGVRVLTHETTCDRPYGLFPSDHESVVVQIQM